MKILDGNMMSLDKLVLITLIYWIMKGLIQRADFIIEKAQYIDGFLAVYVCSKP